MNFAETGAGPPYIARISHEFYKEVVKFSSCRNRGGGTPITKHTVRSMLFGWLDDGKYIVKGASLGRTGLCSLLGY